MQGRRILPFVVPALVCAAAPAHAMSAELQRIVLLPSPDRVSVVFEMTSAPLSVVSRPLSNAVLEIEATAADATRVQSLAAPAGVRFVSNVAVHTLIIRGRPALRARITLRESARSAVRLVGRRLYVDLSAADAPMPARPLRPAPRTLSAAAAVPAADDRDYVAAITPAIDELERVTPFLISAATAPTPTVLAAVGESVGRAAGVIRSASAPGSAQQSHALLLAAADLASRAIDPAFAGDRGAEARQAIVLLDQAKAAMQQRSAQE
jgi:hypothetical protein